MAIIKLTEALAVRKDGLKIIVYFSRIKTFFEITGSWFREIYVEDLKGKRFRCSLFNDKYVKETPEEILALIKEAENA